MNPLHLRLSFAASGTVTGLIGNGVSYFLLLYYSQVLGLDPALAGLAMLIALVFDAVSDPLVGRWSDRLRHRWGRRHPFLFAAILPLPVAYYFLWDAPALQDGALFAYMVLVTISMRLAMTIHVVPFNALAPELAPTYDGRTSLMNDWYASSWFIGTIMAVAMYAYWLADTPQYPDGAGILRADGYVAAGGVSAVIVLVCLAYSAFATRRHIPQLAQAPSSGGGWRQGLAEVRATLGERSFFAMLTSGLFGAMASGTATALWAYMQPYFWGFGSEQISAMLAAQLASAVIAFFAVAVFAKGRDKKRLLIGLSLVSMLISTGPVAAHLLGVFFASDGGLLFPAMLLFGVLQVALIVMTSTLTASMIADITEQRELATGRREEGLLMSVQSFISKVATGVGVWTGGLMLSLVSFPTGTAATDVSAQTVASLGWLYFASISLFYLLSIWMLMFYQIDRAAHDRTLQALGRSA